MKLSDFATHGYELHGIGLHFHYVISGLLWFIGSIIGILWLVLRVPKYGIKMLGSWLFWILVIVVLGYLLN